MSQDFIAPPTDATGYLGAAQGMLAGARPLLQVKYLPALAITHLCGHGCESVLKAILVCKGMTSDELSKKRFGHNILALWAEAEKREPRLPFPRPDWVGQLNQVHASPFQLRYPLGFHAIVLPNQSAMVQGIEELISLASSCIHGGSDA